MSDQFGMGCDLPAGKGPSAGHARICAPRAATFRKRPLPLTPRRIVIASRRSRLAMWQSAFVQGELRRLYPSCEVEILGMSTRGDEMLDVSLAKVGGKGLFVKELEAALADGRADIAVHSAKDVPMDL